MPSSSHQFAPRSSSTEGLKNKLKEHNEAVGDDPRKQTTLSKLRTVYNRGIGAYKTNPSSVRPNVKSPEQWAMARVNSFLYALRNLKFRSGKHDTDLLPSGHPAKPKKNEAAFETFKPTSGMVTEAKRGLEWRREFKRGGTSVGVARARQLANRQNLSISTVRRMHSFFSRHEKSSKGAEGFDRGEEGYPSAGRIAWALWGGDAGQSWARRIVEQNRDLEEMEPTIFTFDINSLRVDREEGVLRDVVIIEAGEARGHEMMITDESLDAALEVLSENPLPAYISHSGAFTDRLIQAVGVFSDFYLDGEKIKAGKFEFFESFRKDEKEKYNRLMELIEKAPETFGISIVFEGELFWKTSEGLVEFGSEKPEDSLHKYPVAVPNKIKSADFVDTPAATTSLFSAKGVMDKEHNNREMNSETEKVDVQLDESASEKLEAIRAAEQGEQGEKAPAPVEAVEKEEPKKRKKRLSEEFDDVAVVDEEIVNEADELEDEDEEVYVDPALEQRDKLISDQQAEIAELQNQIEVLKKCFSGTEAISEDVVLEEKEETADELIEKYLADNPTHGRMTAILEVGKVKPQLFNL
jgi:hypothetical protein